MSQPTKVKFGNGGQKLVLEIFELGQKKWFGQVKMINFLRSGKISFFDPTQVEWGVRVNFLGGW